MEHSFLQVLIRADQMQRSVCLSFCLWTHQQPALDKAYVVVLIRVYTVFFHTGIALWKSRSLLNFHYTNALGSRNELQTLDSCNFGQIRA